MDQLRKLLAALNMRQRITIVVAAVAVVAAVMGLTSWHRESDFKALYTSLAPEDAAAVIQKLKEAGSEYRVSESGTAVLAPSARVAELRLELAAAGLPRTGRIGYELFDKTNLGATEFTEHLNFHRALEGELERSIGALSAIEQARVHITFPKESVFLDSRQPAKASVLLKLRPGSHLSPQNIAAVTNLVASAVEGLGPEAVSVLDMSGNLLNRPRAAQLGDDQPSEATIEYRQKLENDLLAKVNATLEPLLGADKFKAGVSVDCDFTSGEQSEESVDPTKSVMLTSQKTEEQTGSNLASGQPGTASALPRPTSRPGSSGASGVSRRSENVSFLSSRIVRHTKLPLGVIKRLSISVLVDHVVHMEGKGVKAKRVLSPPPPETMKAIRDLVAAATGFSVERGDQFVLEALPFESTANFQPEPTVAPVLPDGRVPKPLQPFVKDFNTLLFYGAIAVVGLIFLAVVLVLLMKMTKSSPAESNKTIAAAEGERAHTGEEVGARIEAALAGQQERQRALQLEQENAVLNALAIPIATTKKAEVLIKHLRDNISKDVESTANVFRSWMSDTEKKS
jgi:flagellar M-ring protein FliF